MREFVLHLCRGVCAAALIAAATQPAAADPVGWPQPNGPGTPVYLTYSYSNLLQPGFNTVLSPAELRAATESAFGLWARYAPVHLFEIADSGPAPSEVEYSRDGTPDIRIGYEPALPEGDVAHVHMPFARNGYTATGLGGDIHFSNDLRVFDAEQWGRVHDAMMLDFFSVMVHEAGHALGLFHMTGAASVMGAQLHMFGQPPYADLFPADIAAIRALYGRGRGAVSPLDQVPPIPSPEPASMLLLTAGVGVFLLRRHQLGYNLSSWRPNFRRRMRPRSAWQRSSHPPTMRSSPRT